MLEIKVADRFEEFQQCVEMYMMKYSGFLPTHFATSMAYIQAAARQGVLVLAVDNGRVLGFNLFNKRKLEFSNTLVVNQQFFCTDAPPATAVKCVYLLHDYMVAWGERMGCELAISAGSYEDEKNAFVKILAHYGWDRKGYCAKKELRKK